MEQLIYYFEKIPSLHRSAILVGGLTFFWILGLYKPLATKILNNLSFFIKL